MQIEDVLREPQIAAQVDALAKSFGIDRTEAEAVIASVLPEISRRLERQTLSRGGLADVVGLLGASTEPPGIGTPEGEAHGNALLSQLMGSKDASRALAARAAASSGLGETLIKAMLPFIISMVMNVLSGKMKGGLGDILSKLPQAGGSTTRAPSERPRADAPPRFPTPPAGSSPLPGPEGMELPGAGSNPYGDLSDVIRRGGSGTSVGGSSLWSIVRGLLGGILGFKSRGIVGWVFRLIFMRWGWQLLTRILGRVFTGR